MTADQVLRLTASEFVDKPKRELVQMLRVVCDRLTEEREFHREEFERLRAQVANEAREREQATQREINRTANQPSGKQAAREKGEAAKPKRRRKRRPDRPGAGNRPKPAPDVVHENPLLACPRCESDLADRPVLETPSRIVEDIAPPPEKTIVSQEIQQRQWCGRCRRVVSSQSVRALPKSDIGL